MKSIRRGWRCLPGELSKRNPELNHFDVRGPAGIVDVMWRTRK
jgi:hypothetical protein